MVSKLRNLEAAVTLIESGSSIGIGGMTLYRRPMAIVHELIRQRKKQLTLIALTAGIESDLLVGVGAVDTVRTSYFGLEYFGLAPMFTMKMQHKQLNLVEETEATIAFGLRATLANVSFMPARALFGTDILKVRKDIKYVSCPYTGNQYVAIPAIKPAVALIHAVAADEYGNALLKGQLCIDRELALAAKKTIITTERIVSTTQIKDAGGADVIAPAVDVVVEVPRGAYPTSCYPEYTFDKSHILHYIKSCKAGEFDKYVDKYVYQNS
jgi:glutaconate CoA-transferase subunit A